MAMPVTMLPFLAAAALAVVSSHAERPRVCQATAGEDCAGLWAEFSKPTHAVVILTFEGDGYFAGARATITSTISRSKAPLLFAVASNSHASAIADWFSSLAAASGHALTSVDPHSLPDVRARTQELSGYSRPDHHSDWGTGAPSALYRVFLRKLFPHAKQAVYVDADVIVQADVAAVAAEVSKSMAMPLMAARSANLLKMRMDYCCQASQKVKKLLSNTSALEPREAELLQEFQDLVLSYREFNNGVMALDLVKLEEVGVFKTLEEWLRLNVKHGLFNNDQHAWNLAATLHWQDLQQAFATNAPSLELLEVSLQAPNPAEHIKTYLRNLAFVHYTNKPKPWQVDWTQVPKGSLFDDGIWHEMFKSAGGPEPAGDKHTPVVRELPGQQVSILRPLSTTDENFEYGMLYMEGQGGMGLDHVEARWRFEKAAAAGDAQGKFMSDRGLDEELRLTDKRKLEKLDRCWNLAGLRINSNEDHRTLREVYKMSEFDYLYKKAPAMVSSCYWRLNSEDVGPRDRSAQEIEMLFGSNDEVPSAPSLSRKLAQWLELLAKDKMETVTGVKADGSAVKPPPVELSAWHSFAALGLLGTVVGGLVWKMLQTQGDKDRKKKKKKST